MPARELTIADEVLVDAPAARVWQAIRDPAEHAAWHPFVTRIDGEHRLGAVRECGVAVGKKTGATRERCVEDEEARRIAWAIEEDSSGFGRMVSDWRAGFALEPRGRETLVEARSTFTPKNVLVRALVPLVRRRFHRAQQAILAGLKGAVEERADAGQAAS